MPAKTGAQYIANLRDNPAEVWLRGERVADVTTHPALGAGCGRWPRCMTSSTNPACGTR